MKLAFAVLVFFLAGCGDLRLALFDSDSGSFDAANGSDATEDATAEGGGCGALDQPCMTSDTCCSGLCKLDPTSRVTCRPATGCIPAKLGCTYAGECCSLKCDRTCAPAGYCARIGEGCARSSDCCSDVCVLERCEPAGGGCKPAGESCKASDECCGRACSDGNPNEGLRCSLLQGCRAEGEICKRVEDCCTGVCTLESSGTSRCKKLAGCTSNDGAMCSRQVGEPCKSAQDCCSRLCLPTGEGVKRCAPAGGCRLVCELCTSNAQCCSGQCAMGRCAPGGACGAQGEACLNASVCCPMGSGSCASTDGVLRCIASMTCGQIGAACSDSVSCCAGRCRPSPDLQCRTGCASDGDECSSRDDCCGSFSDCMRLQGEIVCAPIIR